MTERFVNLLGDYVPSEAEIVNWSEAIVQRTVPERNERILTRRFLGALLPEGHPLYRPMTPEQQMELAAAVQAFDEGAAAADQARHDAALLSRVLAAESETAELAEDDAEGHELLAARAAARPPAEEPVNEGINDAQEGSVPPDGAAAGA